MFLRLIFKKIGIKENKFFLAFVYGGFYSVFTFLIFWLAGLYLKNFNFTRYLVVSIIVGVVMFIFYLIKWEYFEFKLKS